MFLNMGNSEGSRQDGFGWPRNDLILQRLKNQVMAL